MEQLKYFLVRLGICTLLLSLQFCSAGGSSNPDDSGSKGDNLGDSANGYRSDPGQEESNEGDTALLQDQTIGTNDAGVSDSSQAIADANDTPTCFDTCLMVVRCAVESCPSVDWQTSDLAYLACIDECDVEFIDRIMEQKSCDERLDFAMERSEQLGNICDTEFCDLACDTFADCAIQECSGIEEDLWDLLVKGCQDDCQETNAVEMLSVSCTELMTYLSQDDEFMAACEPDTVVDNPESDECANEELCEAYSEKVTECMISNCSGNADAFESGLQESFYDFCQSPEECVSVTDAKYVTDQSTTCDSPGLNALGSEAPLDTLCQGAYADNMAQMRETCEVLLDCDLDVDSVDKCMVFLTMADELMSRISCISDAEDCLAVGLCLSGL